MFRHIGWGDLESSSVITISMLKKDALQLLLVSLRKEINMVSNFYGKLSIALCFSCHSFLSDPLWIRRKEKDG